MTNQSTCEAKAWSRSARNPILQASQVQQVQQSLKQKNMVRQGLVPGGAPDQVKGLRQLNDTDDSKPIHFRYGQDTCDRTKHQPTALGDVTTDWFAMVNLPTSMKRALQIPNAKQPISNVAAIPAWDWSKEFVRRPNNYCCAKT